MAFSFDFGSKKTSYNDRQFIDPRDYDRQVNNYTTAQGNLPQSYGLLSRETIQRYQDPFEAEVVSKSMGDLDRFRQRALADNKANAIQSGAFSSYDGRAVADALTNEGFFHQAGLLASQLRSMGYKQALDTAQGEHRFSYAYPMARQGILNETLAGITPGVNRTGSSKTKGWQFGFQSGDPMGGGGGSGGGGSGGGGGSDYGKMMANFIFGGGGG